VDLSCEGTSRASIARARQAHQMPFVCSSLRFAEALGAVATSSGGWPICCRLTAGADPHGRRSGSL